MNFIKKLFNLFCCKHDYVDKCSVKTYHGTNWQDYCISREHTKSCRKHDENFNLLEGYCDFYYKECKKCGKKSSDN